VRSIIGQGGFTGTRATLFLALALGASVSLLVSAVSDQAEGQPANAAEKSARLTQAPQASFNPADGFYTTAAASRLRAREVMQQVPFPPNRNSADRLAWENQGSLAEGDIELLVQSNAMCDWLQYAADQASAGQVETEVKAVLRGLPAWPAIRSLPFNQQLGEAVEAVQANEYAPLRALLKVCEPPKKASRPAP